MGSWARQRSEVVVQFHPFSVTKMASETAGEGQTGTTEVKGQDLSPEAVVTGDPVESTQPVSANDTDQSDGGPKPKKKPWSIRNLGLVQRITRKKPQAEETSSGQETPPKTTASREPTPQPESLTSSLEDNKPDPEEAEPAQDDKTPSQEELTPVAVSSPSTEDNLSPGEDPVSAPKQPSPAQDEQEAVETNPTSKELSPVPEEPTSAAAGEETASASTGQESEPVDPASASPALSDPDPSPAQLSEAPGEDPVTQEEQQVEEATPVLVASGQPAPAEQPATPGETTSGPESAPSEVTPTPAASDPSSLSPVEIQTPPLTQEESETSLPDPVKSQTPPPDPVKSQTPPPSPEDSQTTAGPAPADMAAAPPPNMAPPAVPLTSGDEIDQSAVELPPSPANRQAAAPVTTNPVQDITQLNQMSLQDLCRDMKQSFKQNSLGLQTRLIRLDDRMSAVERMQFLIRKQSEEMQDLKWRMAEAERRSKEDQKKVTLHRRKMKELQNSLQEMQVKEAVRVRAEKELERREAERQRQQQQQQQQRQQPAPNQIITLTQPMPIFLPSGGYGQEQQPYAGRRDSGYYQPMPPPQPSYQQPALPPPPASVVELPPERTQSPPPPPPSQPAASRRGSVFSVKSFKSSRKGVQAQ